MDMNSTNPVIFGPGSARGTGRQAAVGISAGTQDDIVSGPRSQTEPPPLPAIAPARTEPPAAPAPALFPIWRQVEISPRMRQTLGIAATLATIGTVVGLDFSTIRARSDSAAVVPQSTLHRQDGESPLARSSNLDEPIIQVVSTVSSVPGRASASRSALASTTAEALRLHAALLRIAAERLDAASMAADAFRDGEASEAQGVRLLEARKYTASQEAFRRAAQLFARAESLSHEERARQLQLSDGPLTSGL